MHDGCHEPVNIFTVTSLSPGNRKTAVFAAITKPLEDYERSKAKRTAGEIGRAKTAYKIKESTLKRLQEQAVTATGKKRESLTQEAGALAAELEEIQVSAPTRCIVDDCKPEKLASLLRDQGGRIAVMSPEGDVFDLMAGRYSSNSTTNFAVYLKGHAGGTLRVDRVGRAPEFVRAPALTIGLAVQPEVIRGLAEKPGFRGRGLLGRFLYALPASMLGRRDTDRRARHSHRQVPDPPRAGGLRRNGRRCRRRAGKNDLTLDRTSKCPPIHEARCAPGSEGKIQACRGTGCSVAFPLPSLHRQYDRRHGQRGRRFSRGLFAGDDENTCSNALHKAYYRCANGRQDASLRDSGVAGSFRGIAFYAGPRAGRARLL